MTAGDDDENGSWIEPLTEGPRTLWVILAALGVAGAVLGGTVEIFHGTRTDASTANHKPLHAAKRNPPSRHRALSYDELPGELEGPNTGWENHLKTLASKSQAQETRRGRSERGKKSLSARASRRAYDGAPPMIPHVADERSSTNCVACHSEGLMVGSRVAPPIPHPLYQSCTQCHARTENTIPSPGLHVESGFVGKMALGSSRVQRGPRRPPVIPHSTWMRQECSACHGVQGTPGIRTTHPGRMNCVQCHARSAALEQDVTTSLLP